jgi:hypothetical protein
MMTMTMDNASRRALATPSERAQYAKVEDYGEGGTMMNVDQDEGMFEDIEPEEQPHTGEQEEEYSGYIDEESYGADNVAEEDEDMMNF